jgi:hypothetical protein
LVLSSQIHSVSTARFILAVLLCASPAILLWEPIAQALVAETVAITLLITARALRLWKTAATALAHPLTGTISVDPGATKYLSVIAGDSLPQL